LHWAAVHIARQHRQEDIAASGQWACPCPTCEDVLAALARTGTYEEIKRVFTNGGAR
jgi:hypothetical protein